MPFSASAILCFTSSIFTKCFLLWPFHLGKQTKKSCLWWDHMNREGGALGSCRFWSKTAEHLAWCGAGVLVNHPLLNLRMLKVFKKSLLLSSAASPNNESWCTDTDGFLEHSPSRRSLYCKESVLQKTIPFWGVGSPLVC